MSSESLPAVLQTPRKLGRLVLGPSYKSGDFDSHMVDCPFPFRHEGRFHMTYVGWDSMGYRTGLAVSDDLLHWTKLGLIVDRGPKGSPTEFNAAATSILRDNELFGDAGLKRVHGRFVGTYHAYPAAGYESGPASIGLCSSDDLYHWEMAPPVLRAEDADAGAWEQGGLYKSFLLEDRGTYYLFYNAKTRTPGWPWAEQTGFATSADLVHWKRHPGNPVLRNGEAGAFDDLFASDPVVLRHEGRWLMFYFGNSSDGHARDSVAISSDLVQWEKTGAILIDVGLPGSVDCQYAHKPGIISRGGRLFHFYCAVRPAAAGDELGGLSIGEVRGIALATGDEARRS